MKKAQPLGKDWFDHPDPVAAIKAYNAAPKEKTHISHIKGRVLLFMPDGAVNVVPLSVFAKVSVGDIG